jgi:predicted Zn-dependent protease
MRLLSLLVFVACATNPVTGKREFMLLSESQEISMGRAADPQIVATYGLYDDPELAAYVDDVGQKLAAVSHRADLEYTFRVLDSPVINAFALPGGYIYVTRGILAHMNNEAELAMVLGHEIGHVTARHSAEQYSRATLAGLGLGIGSLVVPEVAQYGHLAQTALGLLFLKYGRDDEHESDELGVQYSLAAGYDPERGASFFEVLDRQQQESGQALPGWLSTHPAPADRVARTRARAAEVKGQGVYRVGEATHKERIDGTVFGDDPRQGFMDGDTFKHPDQEFQLELPAGWRVVNAPAAVVATEPKDQAQLQLTLERSEGASPRAFVLRLSEAAEAQIMESGVETIQGYDAYIALLQVTRNGQTGLIQVGAIQRETGGLIYQILGRAASRFRSWQPRLLESIRSFAPLQDRAALRIEPNRLVVVTLARPQTLEQAAAGYAEVPVAAEKLALLNNLRADSPLDVGFRLKIVRGTYHGGRK